MVHVVFLSVCEQGVSAQLSVTVTPGHLKNDMTIL